MHIHRAITYVALLATLSLAGDIATASEDDTHFETTIRPLLASKCYACHSGERADGGLRIDSRAAFDEGGNSGRKLVDGSGGAFMDVIHRRASIAHPEIELATNEIEHLIEWIRSGASWPETHALDIELLDMPERVRAAREQHWAFQPVRRPIAPDVKHVDWSQTDIDRFIARGVEAASIPLSPLADKRTLLRRAYYDLIGLPPSYEALQKFEQDDSSDAFAKVVDELLASPRYGERWGRHWLDVARYSDTKGQDARLEPYFPFSYTYRDYVIRAFNEDLPYDQFIIDQIAADQRDLGDDKRALAALGFITLGRQFPGDYHATLDDQIDVVTRGLQGLTVNCARCHDHKHDPIPTADYYSLYGIFRSATYPEVWPLIDETTATETYTETLAKLEQDERTLIEEIRGPLEAHMQEKLADYLAGVNATWKFESDEEFETYANEHDLKSPLVKMWRDHIRDYQGEHASALALWRAAANDGIEAVGEQIAQCENGSLRTHFSNSPPLSLNHVADGYMKLALQAQASHDALRVDGISDQHKSLKRENISSLDVLREIFFGIDSPFNLPDESALALGDDAARSKVASAREAIRKHMYTHPGRPDRAMALVNRPQPFDPYVFVRGNATSQGDPVARQYLDVLAHDERSPFTAGRDRLELAKVIASRENPLTARVMVNRVWMHHFGRPIVGTPSDFGLRGDVPSHPDLLDYLAWQFMEDDWSVKQLHRRIMLTHAYQQSSVERADGMERDPDNELFWRQNRRRLDFEAMRDSILVASGNLDLRMGGLSDSITKALYSKRRTVYAEIDRQYLPTIFGTFDFALPNSHRSKRHSTTVPQQALFMMNSPFVAEQAKALAARFDGDAVPVRELYRKLFLRDPLPRELEVVEAFVNQKDTGEILKPYTGPITWQYGHGSVNEETGRVESFTEFAHWSGESYQAAEKQPSPVVGPAQLDRYGGHPGTPGHAAIRRWISSVDSTVSFVGELFHYSADGDGITGYVISSREGILWQGNLQNEMLPTVFHDAQVKKGDTIDLVIACNGDAVGDRFKWHPRLYLSADDAAQYPKQDWLTRFDFAPPPPKAPVPLTAWERYAQVLLMTNEFMFVD